MAQNHKRATVKATVVGSISLRGNKNRIILFRRFHTINTVFFSVLGGERRGWV